MYQVGDTRPTFRPVARSYLSALKPGLDYSGTNSQILISSELLPTIALTESKNNNSPQPQLCAQRTGMHRYEALHDKSAFLNSKALLKTNIFTSRKVILNSKVFLFRKILDVENSQGELAEPRCAAHERLAEAVDLLVDLLVTQC